MANDNKVQMTRLVEKLERRGFTVVKSAGHFQVKKPNGARLVTLPGTPGDHRAIDNAYAELRRQGVDVRKHDGKKKGSIDDFALARLRERLIVQLGRVTRAELSRLCQWTAHKKKLAPFGSIAAGESLIKRVAAGEGRITKSNHNLLAATLNTLESSDESAVDKHVKEANELAGLERGRRNAVQPPASPREPERTEPAAPPTPLRAVERPSPEREAEEVTVAVTEIRHVLELRLPAAERAFVRELLLAVLQARAERPDSEPRFGW